MAGAISVSRLTGDGLRARLDDVAALRIKVFRAWPYLYAGDRAYEKRYLATLAEADGAVIVAAFDTAAPRRDRTVGVATASPLAHHHAEFATPFAGAGLDVAEWFYLAESVLLPAYRGRGLGVRFFQEREAAAREQGFRRACFCAVVRGDDPRRPDDYTPLDGFWHNRGYAPLDGVTATFHWREVGGRDEVAHMMQFWGREL